MNLDMTLSLSEAEMKKAVEDYINKHKPEMLADAEVTKVEFDHDCDNHGKFTATATLVTPKKE